MEVFFLSGLGADKTVFQFLDLSYCHPVFIDWLPPKRREDLRDYAVRLKEEFIPDNAVVVGLSFGGMLATEIAKEYTSVKPVLISSAKTRSELPSVYSAGKFIPLHQWSPYYLQKWFMLRMKWLFGLTDKKTQQIYETIIRNSNSAFNVWAVDAILNWKNTEIPKGIVHIHGTHDRVLPYKNVQSDFAIKKGGHLMVMENADIMSKLLKKIITNDRSIMLDQSSSDDRSVHLFQE